MIRKHIYPHLEKTLNQTAGFLAKKNITPNQLTLGGLGLIFISGMIYASGHFFWGGIFLLFGCMGDMLDGALARVTSKASKFGAFLDSTTDRYGDVFLFGGLAVHYANIGQSGWVVICLFIIAGAYATSYSKARAENFIDDCSVGVFERPERMIGLGVLSLFPSLSPLALWTLAIGTNYTAIQRILHTKSKLNENTTYEK